MLPKLEQQFDSKSLTTKTKQIHLN